MFLVCVYVPQKTLEIGVWMRRENKSMKLGANRFAMHVRTHWACHFPMTDHDVSMISPMGVPASAWCRAVQASRDADATSWPARGPSLLTLLASFFAAGP